MPKTQTFPFFGEVCESLFDFIYSYTLHESPAIYLVPATKHSLPAIFNEHFLMCAAYNFHSLQFHHKWKFDVYIQMFFY